MAAVAMRRDLRWWKADEHAVATALWSYQKRLEEAQDQMRTTQLLYARLYGGTMMQGLRPGAYSSARDDSKIKLNVIQSVIDTITAKIGQARPVPQFLTSGGDYQLRRKAEKLNKFGRGLLLSSTPRTRSFYQLSRLILRDGCIFGTGYGKVFAQDKRVCTERTYPWELFVDDAEAYYGEPRTIVQRRFIDRDVLLERFGGRKGSRLYDLITKAKRAPDDAIGRDSTADQIETLEAWRVRSGPKASDGRHVISIQNGTLVEEEWKRERLPFVTFRWNEPIAGWHGRGLVEELIPIQFEINVLLQKIQRAFHLLGVTKVILDTSSGVPSTHITNDIAIIKIAPGSRAPMVVAPSVVNPEIFMHLRWLVERAYDMPGVSQLSASAKKPAGLDAGVAIREVSDIESERHILPGQRYEDLHMDTVRVGLDVVREIDGFTVDVPDRNAKVEIAWKDVKLEDTAYVLQCFPSSLLPHTPAGRLQRVQELMGSGLIPKERGLELLGAPDLEEMESTQTAGRRACRSRIEKMLDMHEDGYEYVSPEPGDDLESTIAMCNATYLDEREKGAPEEVLAELRRYRDDASAMVQAMKAPAPSANGAAAGDAAAVAGAAAPMAPPMNVPEMAAA